MLWLDFDENPSEEPAEPLRTEILEFTLELANAQSTEGVVPSVAELFEQAKADAQAILDAVVAGDASVTQEQIDSCWQNLIDVMQHLSFMQGDKTNLEKVIALAAEIEAKLDGYVEAGQAEFIDALAAARSVYDDADAMQDEVDDAWMTLLKTTSDLRLKADKAALEELINAAESVDVSAYTEDSVQVFKAAFANALNVLADDTLSEDDQDVVNEAAEQLAAAQSALVVKDTASEPETPGQGTDDPAQTENPDQNAGGSSDQGAGTIIADNSGVAGSAGSGNSADNGGQNSGTNTAQKTASGSNAAKTGDSAAPIAGTATVMALAAAAAVLVLKKKRA